MANHPLGLEPIPEMSFLELAEHYLAQQQELSDLRKAFKQRVEDEDAIKARLEAQVENLVRLVQRAASIFWETGYTPENLDKGTVPPDIADWLREQYELVNVVAAPSGEGEDDE